MTHNPYSGSVDLLHWFPWLPGNSQLKHLITLASLFVVTGVAITVLSIREVPQRIPLSSLLRSSRGYAYQWRSVWVEPFAELLRAAVHLPRAIRYVCHVQFFAWIGWFPFNFFS